MARRDHFLKICSPTVSGLPRESSPQKNNRVSLYGREDQVALLLFGNDINVYSMARAFHERYGLRSTVWGKYLNGPCHNSAIIDFHVCAENDQPEYFTRHVGEFAERHRDRKVFLLGCGDSYVQLCSEHRNSCPENVIVPYPRRDLVEALSHKGRFCGICEEHSLSYPETFVHRQSMGDDFTLTFAPPYILKPANPIMYWQRPFPGQKKVYRLADRGMLNGTLERIYASGYGDAMVIQKLIPGDDTHLRVMTGYANKEGRVALMALGHVYLEEHSPQGIGNAAVIVNECDEALAHELKDFLEAIRFIGFFSFDLKYDRRDGKYKVLEINVRQGRSNYHVTGAGYNLAGYMVEDYLLDRPAGFTIAREKYLWSVVPRRVMFGRIRPRACREAMRELIAQGRTNSPLHYPADRGAHRRLQLLKSRLRYLYQFHRHPGEEIT